MSTLEREPFFGDLACNKLYNLIKKQFIESLGKPKKDQHRERTSSYNNLTSAQKLAHLLLDLVFQDENWVCYKFSQNIRTSM